MDDYPTPPVLITITTNVGVTVQVLIPPEERSTEHDQIALEVAQRAANYLIEHHGVSVSVDQIT